MCICISQTVEMVYYRAPANKNATTLSLQTHPDGSVTEGKTLQSW